MRNVIASACQAMRQLPNTFHEGRAVIEWLKPYNYLLVPEILEVRESPVMLPERDVLRTIFLEFAEWMAV
jgi:hypothetical protein